MAEDTMSIFYKGAGVLVLAGIMLALSVLVLDGFIDSRDASSTSDLNITRTAWNNTVNSTLDFAVRSGSVVLYNGTSDQAVPTSNYTVYYPVGGEHDFAGPTIIEFNGGVSDIYYRNETIQINYTRLYYGEEVAVLNNTLSAYTDLASWMGTIIIVFIASIVVGFLMFYFKKQGIGGGGI